MSTFPHSAYDAATRAGVTILTASLGDLPEVLRVQRAAFRRLAAKSEVPDTELPPLAETLDDLEALLAEGVRTFVAVAGPSGGESVVGTVRATVHPDGVIEIGRLAVDDGFVRRGVGTALMLALEEAYPEAGRFELFTGAEVVEPLGLYARLGYREFHTARHGVWNLVWLAKDRRTATTSADTRLH